MTMMSHDDLVTVGTSVITGMQWLWGNDKTCITNNKSNKLIKNETTRDSRPKDLR